MNKNQIIATFILATSLTSQTVAPMGLPLNQSITVIPTQTLDTTKLLIKPDSAIIYLKNQKANEQKVKEELDNLQQLTQAQLEQSVSIPQYLDYSVPSGMPFKSYTNGNIRWNHDSAQYNLLQSANLDYDTGIYTVNGRYCCALGTYYSTTIGTNFDIVMQSGAVIPCVLADVKADAHTDAMHQYTVANDSIVEFLVNTSVIIPKISSQWGNTGDVSYVNDSFNGEISYIRIYNN